MTAHESTYFLDTWHAEGEESPNDWGGWRVISFGRRHVNYQDPATVSIAPERFTDGTAFRLSYHEHGLCAWSLLGGGPRCQWDTVDRAGIVVFDGPAADAGADFDARRYGAEQFLRAYTNWCNGHIFGISLRRVDTTADGFTREEFEDSIGGFYGFDTDSAGLEFADMLPKGVSADDVNIGHDAYGGAEDILEFARGLHTCAADDCNFLAVSTADYCAGCITRGLA